MVRARDRVLVASSGGKDSVTLTYIMNSLSGSLGLKCVVLHVDLGIGDFSKESRDVVLKQCRELGLDYIIFDMKDLGSTLPELKAKLKTKRTCSLCGIVKRYVMNAVAVELGVNAVATAHHADDLLTYIFKNFILQDYNSLVKLGPINAGVGELAVTRIRPLYEVYESETNLYARLKGFKPQSVECPFKKVGHIESSVKNLLNELETRAPGIKIAILRKFAKSVESLNTRHLKGIRKCSRCGLIAQGSVCSFCKLTERVSGHAMGSLVRSLTLKYVHNQQLR